jgi:hypothetical protein
MNPNRFFERWALKKPQSLRQCLSKSLGDKTPQKEVGSRKKDQYCKEDVIKVIDHIVLLIANFQIQNKFYTAGSSPMPAGSQANHEISQDYPPP